MSEPYEMIERRTPGGNLAWLRARLETNDGAVAQSILGDDEYRLRAAYPLTGWAVDIGAHIGSVGIALGLDNPDLRVVMVEALPENVEMCIANVEHNELAGRVFVEGLAATTDRRRSVEVTYNYRHVGVGRTGEEVDQRYLDQCRYIGNIFQPGDDHEQESDTIAVPGIGLAGLLRKYAIDRVALLKIDCEGCEYEFFRSKALSRVDRIVGEYHDSREFSDLRALLEPTHVVEQWTEGTVGMFGAVAR